MTSQPSAAIRLIEMVFPGDTNHHGTLFGGVALAHMDKVAFLVAARHGRVPFVTAATERIDFAAPAYMGEMVEVTGRVTRVGRSSLDVEVELVAEDPVTGERRLCTRGRFVMVAVKEEADGRLPLPPLAEAAVPAPESDGWLRLAGLVFPSQANHYGTFYGGDALKAMGEAAFIMASRHARQVMVMAASDHVDFTSPIRTGEMIECAAHIQDTGRSSVRVGVELWAEDLMTGMRRRSASAAFVMVAVDEAGRPLAFHATGQAAAD